MSVEYGSALFVTGVEYEVMESILDFMYTGVLNCSHEKKNEFTRDELRRSYNYYDLALKTMRYDSERIVTVYNFSYF